MRIFWIMVFTSFESPFSTSEPNSRMKCKSDAFNENKIGLRCILPFFCFFFCCCNFMHRHQNSVRTIKYPSSTLFNRTHLLHFSRAIALQFVLKIAQYLFNHLFSAVSYRWRCLKNTFFYWEFMAVVHAFYYPQLSKHSIGKCVWVFFPMVRHFFVRKTVGISFFCRVNRLNFTFQRYKHGNIWCLTQFFDALAEFRTRNTEFSADNWNVSWKQ